MLKRNALQGLFKARQLLYACPHAEVQQISQQVQSSGLSVCEDSVVRLQQVGRS